MKTIFSIESSEARSQSTSLFIELGPDYIMNGYLDSSGLIFKSMEYRVLEQTWVPEELKELFEGFAEGTSGKIIFCSALHQAILTPKSFFNNYSLLELMFGKGNQNYFNDQIPDLQIVNQYSIPSKLFSIMEESFTGYTMIHAYTVMIKSLNNKFGEQIQLHFSTSHFRVLVRKSNQIVLAQTYSYKTPLDVVYYLIKISGAFQLDQSGIKLIISGLMDKDSSLFKELYQYFKDIEIANPVYGMPSSNLPAHYFSSLSNLAECGL